jgi:ribosomal protein S19E (S16A)
VVMKLEAFDLSDKGRNTPYFRREMLILNKVLQKPGIEMDKIINEFSKEQIEGIYPALSPIMVLVLREELELTGYLEVQDGKVFISDKGKAKLDSFKESLSKEERKALDI